MGGVVAHLNSPIVCCKFEGMDSGVLAGKLMERGIVVSARHGWLRVSVHLYNDEEDVGVFYDAVREIIA